MGSDASAYRVLGLEPGADPAAVENAYRKLIKRHHPDRQGGDSGRAAEINRAYQQIRKAQRLPAVRRSGFPTVRRDSQRPRRGAGPWLGAALGAALAVLLVERSGLDLTPAGLGGSLPGSGSYEPAAPASRLSSDPSGQPLDSDAIDRSVLNAVRLANDGELERLAAQSRRCHAELRDDPSLSRLDQCVAFDEAVVVLMQASGLEDGGRFSTSAVTGRQIGAARLFTDDYLVIESRLDRIRSRVEFNLAPADPRPVPQLDL